MTCKDCKGTGKYQPFYGPSEPCRACQVSHDSDLGRVPFDSLWLTRPVSDYRDMRARLIRDGYNSFYPIRYEVNGQGQMLVHDGNIRVAALRSVQSLNIDLFDKILPDGLIPAIKVKSHELY